MKHWIAVASAEHVAIGRAQGFMQVCHGKAAPLRRLRTGDCVVYYSPVQVFGGKEVLQAFTAIGHVADDAPYQVEMYPGFFPFRRNVDWLASQTASIRPLLEQLEFSQGRRNWAYPLRFGLVEISAHDMHLIAKHMRATLTPSRAQAPLFPHL